MSEGRASVKITADDIARLKGENLNTVQKRLRRGCVAFEKDPSDTRRNLYDPAAVLTGSELARWPPSRNPRMRYRPKFPALALPCLSPFSLFYHLMFPPVTKPARRLSRPSRKGFALKSRKHWDSFPSV